MPLAPDVLPTALAKFAPSGSEFDAMLVAKEPLGVLISSKLAGRLAGSSVSSSTNCPGDQWYPGWGPYQNWNNCRDWDDNYGGPAGYHWCPGQRWDPGWGANWDGGRCHDDHWYDGEARDQGHWHNGPWDPNWH